MPPRIGILCGLSDPDASPGASRQTVPHAYVEAILAAGGAPILIPCIAEREAVLAALEVCSGILLTGGGDLDPALYGQAPRTQLGPICPERDAVDRLVVEYVLSHPHLPALGICRGIQALNVFAGGSLIQDIPTQVPDAIQHYQQAPGWYGTHEIELSGASGLARLLGPEPIRVNSFHHQAVRILAPGFIAVAWTADGVVEAIERLEARLCLGVQFHPELMAPRNQRIHQLFARFVDAARS